MQHLISICAVAATTTVDCGDIDGENDDAAEDVNDNRDEPEECDDDDLIYVAVRGTDDVNEHSCRRHIEMEGMQGLTRRFILVN